VGSIKCKFKSIIRRSSYSNPGSGNTDACPGDADYSTYISTYSCPDCCTYRSADFCSDRDEAYSSGDHTCSDGDDTGGYRNI